MSGKILIIDDETDLRDLLAYNLEKNGFEVSEGSNGLEALELTPKVKPDLILMDIMMPLMDGIQACSAIRKQLQHQPLIMFLTARSEKFAQQAVIDAGANAYLLKPLRTQTLIDAIQSMLLGHGSA
ncbi:MAG: response regulator [Bacteroidota bacterium]